MTLNSIFKMRVRTLGIEFPYDDSTFLWVWPWVKTVKEKPQFMNMDSFTSYYSLREYWHKKGESLVNPKRLTFKQSEKIKGLKYTDIIDLLAEELEEGYYVILHDLDLSSRTKEFWAAIPPESRVELTKDFVIIKCKTSEQAIEIKDSIEPSFGTAKIISPNYTLL
jgi:hypothetical protein